MSQIVSFRIRRSDDADLRGSFDCLTPMLIVTVGRWRLRVARAGIVGIARRARDGVSPGEISGRQLDADRSGRRRRLV